MFISDISFPSLGECTFWLFALILLWMVKRRTSKFPFSVNLNKTRKNSALENVIWGPFKSPIYLITQKRKWSANLIVILVFENTVYLKCQILYQDNFLFLVVHAEYIHPSICPSDHCHGDKVRWNPNFWCQTVEKNLLMSTNVLVTTVQDGNSPHYCVFKKWKKDLPSRM